jgi:7-keto-8-aminopelargonate synthetase-like enzyme
LELEKAIADFEGTEDAVLYALVTVASAGSMVSVMNPPVTELLKHLGLKKPEGKREVFFDWLSHPTLINACVLAVGAENMVPYRHSDMNQLETKLAKSKAKFKMIVTDGLFSTDGDLAKLPDIVSLAERYGAMVFVDDAHGTGVLGQHGRGIWEHFGLSDRIDVKIGSLAKSFAGGLGGFVVGDKDFTDYLRVTGGHYIFGGSIPPGVAMSITASIKTAMAEPWRRLTVLSNAEYLRSRLHALGYDTLGSESPIVPIIIGDDAKAIAVSERLLEVGYFAPAFRYPAVPRKKSRIRVTMMATHTHEHIDGFVEALVKAIEC